MIALLKWIPVVLFAGSAAWQIALGTIPPAGPLPTPDELKVPPAPAGWKLTKTEPIRLFPEFPGRLPSYEAPDGTVARLVRYVGWPDRKDHLPAYIPHECQYMADGYDMELHTSGWVPQVGKRLRTLRVSQRGNRLVEFAGYACRDRLEASWQEFKLALIVQRVQRQRRLWVHSWITTEEKGEAHDSAPQILLESLSVSDFPQN